MPPEFVAHKSLTQQAAISALRRCIPTLTVGAINPLPFLRVGVVAPLD